MDRELIAHFPVVLAVARRGGFGAAAAELGMSPSAVSHAVKTVEERLGLPLFARTTRSVALTEAGAGFVATVGPALTEIGEAVERLRAAKGRITGVLRLNAPRIAQRMALTAVIAEMAWRHPDLVIEVTSDDGLVDIVAGGFDAGVRLGEMIAQDMTAVRLTPPFKAIMVAAPGYIQARGEPGTIADLADHNCIGFRLISTGGDYAWEVQENGVDTAVKVRGSARVTDPLYARDLALAGVGLAYVFEPLVREDIREKRLRWVLADTAIEEPGLFLYFPRRAAQAPKLRAFIDVARAVLKLRA
ncbi:transcriptional regulator [Caulobacter sp. Root655]|uniref:LysR family transcriptional regulator n=1 Tax=Caulobacter sp. Root655 TaxID=1736578 RepID=UPI0006F73853|nr:LysR family transcriptional regulator [Caulobacter sp. Root655]KRA64064.1 transcriptional regulator [Caulobacter sp. Root655]